MLVVLIDDSKAALRMDGVRMHAEISREEHLTYSVEEVVFLRGQHYRLRASLTPETKARDEEEAGP